MCGIYGYVKAKNNRSTQKVCLKGLKSLEYRGYDSAGLAGIKKGRVYSFKSVGKICELEKTLEKNSQELEVAIAHTRWATHGVVNKSNTHPHIDDSNSIAIVHNGIIENHLKIREELQKQGVKFQSETDSEVICQLLQFHYKGSLKEALIKVSKLLKGSFAIAAIHKNEEQKIVATAHKSPLVIAYDKKTNEGYVSSDITPFSGMDLELLFLQNHEFAEICPGKVSVMNKHGHLLEKKWQSNKQNIVNTTKDGFEHFMLKEMHEQPEMVKRNLAKVIHLEELKKNAPFFDQIVCIGCGSSYHAAKIVMYELELKSKRVCRAFIASEYLVNAPKITENTLVIALSQSGETADTLSVVSKLVDHCHVLALTNTRHSSLVRMTKHHLFLEAGIEISVCSTKAFSSQVLNLLLLSNYLFAKNEDFYPLIKALEIVLSEQEKLQELAIKYSVFSNFSFIGRAELVASCQEGALKLKEISYLSACHYPAGEMKHGPIALIDANHPTIALLQKGSIFTKNLSNLSEIKTRAGPILAFSNNESLELSNLADDVYILPSTNNRYLDTIVFGLALQLFAYYTAKELGTNIDQPKNLAKSVTVE